MNVGLLAFINGKGDLNNCFTDIIPPKELYLRLLSASSSLSPTVALNDSTVVAIRTYDNVLTADPVLLFSSDCVPSSKF